MQKLMPYLIFPAVLLATTAPAHAYMGPGAGAGAFAIVIGLIGSVLLGIVAMFWYPIKRLVRRVKGNPAATDQGSAAAK